MRQGTNPRRSRGRGGRKVHNPRSHVFDSNGPSVRIRGSALQIYEKYTLLARDSQRTDRIAAENLAQHAEHYYRLANANNALSNGADRRGFEGRPDDDDEDDGRPLQSTEGNGQRPQVHEATAQPPQSAAADGRQSQPPEPGGQQAAAEVATAPAPPSPPPSPGASESTESQVQEKPTRRRRSPGRPRKTEPAAEPAGDTEPVQA